MLKRFDVAITSNPVCNKSVEDLELEDFQYYDKDGFELNKAEQKYYSKSQRPINQPILNHCCWQEKWFELENKKANLILDHCMILHRCSYVDRAAEQLQSLKKQIPNASLLLETPQKWGFDFALDAVDENGSVYEVLHIEYDSYDYDEFSKHRINFEFTARHTDWNNAAKKILLHRDQWQNLKSFAQNDWKANFLIGWKKAEYTEIRLTF
jgi:hypothetical protein